MILPVYLSEVLPIDVRVDLRGRDVDVAEHLLDGAQVSTALEQVRRERMAQRVGRNRLLDTGAVDVSAQDLPGAHPRERLTARVEKQNSLPRSFLETRPRLADVRRHGADRRA